MNTNDKTPNKETLEQIFTDRDNEFIKLISEALNEKDKIIKHWRNKAQSIASKRKTCLECEISIILNPDLGWVPETLLCGNCNKKQQNHERN